jgi:hypothetical protein
MRILSVAVILASLALGAQSAPSPRQDAASVTGTVKFKGEPPRPQKLKLDATCAAMHDQQQFSEDAGVDKDGGVQWCFVHVTKGLEGRTYDVPKEAKTLDQKGCRYVPHVLGIMAGQGLKIRNGDDLLHNVHAVPFTNDEFNFGQQGGRETVKSFASPEVPVKVKCDLHAWMWAWVCVVADPFYAVTGADGTFEIKGLPPGKYTFAVWHEAFGSRTQEIELKAGEAKAADFVFEKTK